MCQVLLSDYPCHGNEFVQGPVLASSPIQKNIRLYYEVVFVCTCCEKMRVHVGKASVEFSGTGTFHSLSLATDYLVYKHA